MKMEKARELGWSAPHQHLPEDATQADVIAAVRAFNDDPLVDGFLIQHPTPPQIDFDAALLEMDPDKDVDGMHPVNMGRLALDDAGAGAGDPRRASKRCSRSTRSRSPVTRCASSGAAPRSAVRSRCCSRRSATRPTPRSPSCTPACPTGPSTPRRAGIVVAAAGVPGILQPEHITPGAVVVGGGVRYEGRKLLPDVDEACEEVAGAITPRVGGVGPTTIAMLFRNAIEAAERNVQRRAQSGRPDGRVSVPAPRAEACPLCGAPVARERRSDALNAT